jgi:hypothetical protein
MKRKQYQITSTLGHDVIKNAWNSSIREIEKLAKELATQEGADYHLTGGDSFMKGFEHVQGTRDWTNSKNGCTVVFHVRML